MINAKVARWTVMLLKLNLHCLPQKAIKLRVVFNFLTDITTEGQEEETKDFPNEGALQVEEDTWTIYFDGVWNQKGFRVGILLISLEEGHTPNSIKLDFNVAEYETYITRL